MDKLMIQGPNTLKGEVFVSRAKNAYLPILAATLLNPHKISLEDLPQLRDVQTMLSLLENLGVKIVRKGRFYSFSADKILSMEATYDLVRTMRASILVLGPLVARFKKAKISLPGGCAIGPRPIDMHLKCLNQMGATTKLERGYVEVFADKLVGTHLHLDYPSVGTTENLMLTATLAEGETVIHNAALEPEICDLARFLIKMGCEISGIGTPTLSIRGVKKPDDFRPLTYRAIGDRIEAATYIIAGLMTNSNIVVKGIKTKYLVSVLDCLTSANANLKVDEEQVEVFPSELKGFDIETKPYPGFPTDVQAQLMALATIVNGPSSIIESIFENRFMHVSELNRLGATITLTGPKANISGNANLIGAQVMCTDLRASAALVLAALRAEGTTEINRIYHLDRGYEKLYEKLKKLGAKIVRKRD